MVALEIRTFENHGADIRWYDGIFGFKQYVVLSAPTVRKNKKNKVLAWVMMIFLACVYACFFGPFFLFSASNVYADGTRLYLVQASPSLKEEKARTMANELGKSLDKTFFEERSVPLKKKVYVIQIASFEEQKNAINMKKKLEKKGFSLILYKSSRKKKSWFVLALGIFEDKNKAKQAGDRYQNKIKNDPVILRVFDQDRLGKKIIKGDARVYEEPGYSKAPEPQTDDDAPKTNISPDEHSKESDDLETSVNEEIMPINSQKVLSAHDSTSDVREEILENNGDTSGHEEVRESDEEADIRTQDSETDALERDAEINATQMNQLADGEKNVLPSSNEKKAARIKIEDVLFTGNTVIDTEALRNEIKEFRGRELTKEATTEIVEKVTQFYTDKGYLLARAYLPPQYFHPARSFLVIAIVEGKIGEVEIKGNAYYHKNVIKKNLGSQINHKVIKDDKIEEGLIGIKNMPNINAAKTEAFFKKGREASTVDLIIKTENTLPYKMGMDYNNLGSQLTSKNRFGAHFEIVDPMFGGTLMLKSSFGSNFNFGDFSLLDGSWSVPVNGYGTSVLLGYTKSQYSLGKELENLGIKGNSTIYSLKATHPLKRKRALNLRLSAGYDAKHAKNYLLDELYGINHLGIYSLALDFDFDDWFHGKNIGTFGWHYGKVRINDRDFLGRPDADETFSRFTMDYARIQNLHTPFKFAKYLPVIDIAHLIFRVSCQLSMDRLLPMEEVAIGGYGTTRGHESSLFLGDSGYTLSGELNFTPSFLTKKTFFGQPGGQSYKLALFLDHGAAVRNDPELGEAQFESITGYGAGFRLFYKDIFQLKFDMAFPTNKAVWDEDDIYYYIMMSYNFF